MEQPLSKPAENKFDVTGVTHGLEIVDGVVKGYSGTSSDINIPEGVTEIEYNHLTRHGIFDGKIITRIFLPKSLKIIRPSSFRDCSSLEYINIPPNLDKVGDAWNNGIKGTEDVPLEQGIQAVLKTAQKEELKERQQIQEQSIEEK